MLPRGSWIPAERRGVVSSTGACGLLSLGSSSEMLSQRAGGCQLLEARLTFAILEGAGTISISLGPGLRPRGLLLEDPQILVGAGEVAVTLPSLKILPCWLDAGLELYSTPTHNWGLHHPSPHCTPIPSPARCKTQAPSCQVRGGQTSTGLNSGPSSSLTCCVIPLSSPPTPRPRPLFLLWTVMESQVTSRGGGNLRPMTLEPACLGLNPSCCPKQVTFGSRASVSSSVMCVWGKAGSLPGGLGK